VPDSHQKCKVELQNSQNFQSCQHALAGVFFIVLYSHPSDTRSGKQKRKVRTMAETSLPQQDTIDLLQVDVQELEQRQETSIWGSISGAISGGGPSGVLIS
jgi:hypothetical protein